MKLISKVLIILFFFPSIIVAQDYEAGLTFGVSIYQGDLAESFLGFEETNLSFWFILRSDLTDKYSIKANFYRGTISGTDANSSNQGIRDRGLQFKTDIYEFGIHGEWNIFGTNKTDVRGGFIKKKFTPYLFAGLGVVLFDPNVFQGTVKDPEGRDYSTFNLMIPGGGGLKFGINERINLNLELGGRTAFTDYLDGISNLANPGAGDWYWMGNIIVAISLD